MKKLFGRMDIPLLIFTILYAVFGLIMVFSSSSVSAVLRYGVSPYHFFVRQALFVIAGFAIGFIIVLRLPTSKYRFFTPVMLIGIIVALIGLFTYGKIAGGAQSWYNFGFFNFQPLEYAKSILIIYMAVFYSRQLRNPKAEPLSFLIPLVVGFVICILVAMQPDLGGAIIVGAIVFMIFMSVPIPKKIKSLIYKVLGIGIVVGALALLVMGKSIINSSQLARFDFNNPCAKYTDKKGYQVCNGFIAMHNGNILGSGLGNSTQKYLYLPEAHTDFIFAIIVEELGLIIGILIIIGYGFILYRILKIAKASENIRCSILAYGTFLLILSHILVNLLGILALIPLTGVPLPLLSYGGNFSLNIIIMLFIVQRCSIENSINKNKREIAAI